MNKIRSRKISYPVILILVLLVLLLGANLVSTASPVSDAEGLQAVYQRARSSGAYQFSADLTQTTTPLPTVVNAGREAKETRIFMEGQADLPAESLELTLWSQGGSVLVPETGVQYKVSGDQAYTRQGDQPWQPAEDFSGVFAPGGDFMTYLVAAENVVRHEPEVRDTALGSITITRYTYDINGRRYAEHMRQGMMEQAAKDGLPPGVSLELPRVYVDMTGNGELWVGADGFPLRQTFDLQFPETPDDYAPSANVVVDFSDFRPLPRAGAPLGLNALVSRMSQSLTLPDNLSRLLIFIILVLIALIVLHRARSKAVYTTLALAIILSMVVTPLISSRQVSAFTARQAEQRAEQEIQRAEREAQAEMQEQMLAPEVDPHADPLADARALQALETTASTSTSDSKKYFDSSCSTDPGGDIDKDGLTNLQECLLGTLPGVADTDGDLVDDGDEVAGVDIAYQGNTTTWYTDPLNQDSNNDGISDGREWHMDVNNDGLPDDTDGDGTPDMWDQDNDADGVPDRLDLSNYTNTQNTTTFDGGNPMQLIVDDLTYNGQKDASDQFLVKVEFQLSPTNADHLWYTHNVLDWPDGDQQGQIQDSDGKTFFDVDPTLSPAPNDNGDMRLVPMLEIEITGSTDNLPAETCTDKKGKTYTCYPTLEKFGISVQETAADTLTVYVPLQLVTDTNGDKNVAFYGRMFYQADSAWGNAHQVRLVWLVHALVDQCDTYENGVCSNYSAMNDPQVIQSYDDEWYLTGLHITEDHGVDMAIIHEDPAITGSTSFGPTYDAPLYMDTLYGLLYGLDHTYLAGSDCDSLDSSGDCVGDGQRDFTVGTIATNFDHSTNGLPIEGGEKNWNLPNVLNVEINPYDSIDLAVMDTAITQTVGVLDTHFTSYWSAAEPITPTIMLAYDQTYRALNLDESLGGGANLQLNGHTLTASLPSSGDNAVQTNTLASVKWTPYAYDAASGWAAADLEAYWETMNARLGSSFSDISDPDEASTYQTMSQLLYTSVYGGEHNVVQIGDKISSQTYQQTSQTLAVKFTSDTGKLIKISVKLYVRYSTQLKEAAELVNEETGEQAGYAGAISKFLLQELKSAVGSPTKIVVGVVGVMLVVAAGIALYEQYAAHNTSAAWKWTAAVSVGVLMTIFSVVKPVLKAIQETSKVVELFDGDISFGEAFITTLTSDASLIGQVQVASVIGLVISIGISVGIFLYAVGSGKVHAGSIAFNTLIASTIAAIIVALILFILTMTVIGSILVGIIAVIDVFLSLLGSNWTITGWFTDAIASVIYAYDSGAGIDVDTGSLDVSLADPNAGMVAGNTITYKLPLTTTLTFTSTVYTFSDQEKRSNTMKYELDEEDKDLSAALDDRSSEWVLGTDSAGDSTGTITETLSHWTIPGAGVNQSTSLTLNTGYALLGTDCWLGFCTHNRTVTGDSSSALGDAMVFDILPATVDDFVDVASWGRSVKFHDADGDGLLSFEAGGVDPDDTKWDTDGDTLGDSYEATIRAKPASQGGQDLNWVSVDTDGDTIPDGEELRLGTNPNNTDTDGDGISDVLEIAPHGGWFLPYAPGKVTRVWSDPLQADADGDGMTDLFERTQDTCPTCTPWGDTNNPLVYGPNVWNETPVPLYVSDNTRDGFGFVLPGASLVYTTTTVNNLSSGQSLGGNLSLDLPPPFSGGPLSAGVDIASGDDESLNSAITAANETQSTSGVLSSHMRLTDFASTVWSWDPSLDSSTGTVHGSVTDMAATQVFGWSEPFIVTTREEVDGGTAAIVAYLVAANGVLRDSTTVFTAQSGTTITAPGIACTDDGICMLVWGVNSSGGGVIWYSLMNKGFTAPTHRVVWQDSSPFKAAYVASDGAQFMVMWGAQSSSGEQLWALPLSGVGGSLTPKFNPQNVTGPDPNLSSAVLNWGGGSYVAVWSSSSALYRANLSPSDGSASSATEIGPGSGWPVVSGEPNGPAMAYDSISQQSLLLYRATDSGDALHARRLTAAGAAGAIVIDSDSGLSQNGVHAAVCADPSNGGWVAAWSIPGQEVVRYQAIGQDGSLRGVGQEVSSASAPPLTISCELPRPVVDMEFEEPEGATEFEDSSGFSNHAACSGNACPLAGVSGRFGNGIHFNGVDNFLSIPDNDVFDFTAGQDFTVALWVKADPDQSDKNHSDNDIVEKWSGSGGYPFVIRYDNQTGQVFAGRFDGSSGSVVWSKNTINDDQFHHVAFVKRGAALYLYIDGQLDDTHHDSTTGNTTNDSPLYLGMRGSNINHFAGTIDDLIIYNRGLSAKEVADTFEAAAVIFDLDEVAGAQTIVDATNNGYDAVCSGSNCPTLGAQGISYTAAQFDGVDDYLEIDVVKETVETFQYDFESGAGSGWSKTDTAAGSLGRANIQTQILGLFPDEKVTLTLDALPIHDTVTVSFDWVTHGHWDGNRTDLGPDNWHWGYETNELWISNVTNVEADGNYQDYPLQYPTHYAESVGLCPDQTGSPDCMNFNFDVPDVPAAYGQVVNVFDPGGTAVIVYNQTDYAGTSLLYDFAVLPDGSERRSNTYLTDWRADDWANWGGLNSMRIWTALYLPGSWAVDYYIDNGGGIPGGVYALGGTISDHTADSLTLFFEGLGQGYPSTDPEMWGLDNVVVALERDHTSVQLVDRSFTISAWAKQTNPGQPGAILSQGKVAANQGLVFGFRDDRFTCAFWDDDLNAANAGTDSNWHHWACTYDAVTNQRTIYRDGVQVAQDTASADYSGLGPTFVGKRLDDQWYFKGEIDEMGIWTEALTAEAVAELFRTIKVEEESIMSGLLPGSDASTLNFNALTLRETTTDVGAVSQTVTHTLSIDAGAPVVDITAPVNGTLVGGPGQSSLLVAGTASDFSPISKVEVQVDNGGWQLADGSESWSATLDLDPLNEGSHTVSARATDIVGSTSASSSVSFTIDRTPPAVSFSGGSDPDVVRPTRDDQGRWLQPLSGSASDTSGVVSVEVLLSGDQELAGKGWQAAAVSGTTWNLDYIFPAFGASGQSMDDPGGRYTAMLRATDSVGNTTLAAGYPTMRLVVDAAGPVLSMSDPVSTTSVISTTLTLSGEAIDDQTAVASVQVNFTPAEQMGALAGRVLHLPLDENQATEYFVDQSGSGHAAFCSGAQCPTVGQSGQRDKAVAFDGTDDYLVAPFLFDPSRTEFSAAAWFNARSVDSFMTLIEQEPGYGFLGLSGNVLFASPGAWLTSEAVLQANQWYHAALTYDGVTSRLYLNAELVASADDPPAASNAAVHIGVDGDGTSGFFNGLLDEVTMYDRALADYEVANLYAYGSGTWEDASLDGSGWSYTIPGGENGLEGIYQINARGTNSLGNATDLSGQRLWRGEIDTRPPALAYSAVTNTSDSVTTTQYDCETSDFNLVEVTSCMNVVALSSVPQFRGGDMTLTTYDQVDLWYAAAISDTARLYSINATRTYSGTQDTDSWLQTCDKYYNCTLVEASLSAPPSPLLGADVLEPSSGTTLTSTDTITVSGSAYAADGLQSLAVNINGAPVYNRTWITETVTSEMWAFDWTPPGEGTYLFEPVVEDWNTAVQPGTTATIYVDINPPGVSIDPTLLTTTDQIGEQVISLSGTASDSVRVQGVDVSIDNGPWQRAGLSADGDWQYPWVLGGEADGVTYNIRARATDLAGHTTEASENVLVDIADPEHGPIVLSYITKDGQTRAMAPGETLTDAATLQVTWSAGSDGYGISRYEVGFTNDYSAPGPLELTAYLEPGTHLIPAGEAETWYAHVRIVDTAGNSSIETRGPFYVDAPLTPDIVDDLRYRTWANDVCTLQGVDRRLSLRNPGAFGDKHQRFYVTWDESDLRLSWQGADWDYEGDLFIYLDTVPGGAEQLFDPYNSQINIALPGGYPAAGAAAEVFNQRPMLADVMVWVGDSQTASFYRWNGSNWVNEGQLGENSYRLTKGVGESYTEVRLSFDSLGISDPASASLGLLAVATEEDALRLWAAMPIRNPLNGTRVVNPIAAQSEEHSFALLRAYWWQGLPSGLCPNGQLGGGSGPTGGPFADSDLQLSITTDKAGTNLGFMSDHMAWLWEDLAGSEDVPSKRFEHYDTVHPPLGDGEAVTYSIEYVNHGSETARDVRLEMFARFSLDLPGAGPYVNGLGEWLSVPLGDIPPGASGSYTLEGVIDTSGLNAEGAQWATLDVYVFDERTPFAPFGSPPAVAPLEWLMSDHRVDIDPPHAVGIDAPTGPIPAGLVEVRGHAYDQSDVPTIKLEARHGGGSVKSLLCIDPTPQDGQWGCEWHPSPDNDGETFELRAQAVDEFGHVSAWSEPVTVVVDATPPNVTVEPGVDGVVFAAGIHNLRGTITDDRHVDSVQVCQEGGECRVVDVTSSQDGQTSGTWSVHLPLPEGASPDHLAQTLMVYGIDGAGNRSSEPQTVSYWLDFVHPELGVEGVLERLAGTASDGSAFEVFVLVKPPNRQRYRLKADMQAGNWWFIPPWENPGDYELWVQAVDAASNKTTSGPYVIEQVDDGMLMIYMPIVQRK